MAETRGKKLRPQEPVNLETLMGNKPPQAPDVEEAVLGAMLVEPSVIDESMEELSPSCFYEPRHRMIFEAMSALVNEHANIDLVTVSEKLRTQGNLEAIGGPVVLASLSQNIGAAAHMNVCRWALSECRLIMMVYWMLLCARWPGLLHVSFLFLGKMLLLNLSRLN